jgi:hypothetical protein
MAVDRKPSRWLLFGLLALAVVAAVAAVALAKSVNPVSAAVAKSEDAGGAKLALTITGDDGSGHSATVTANGVFDETSADITVDASSALGAANLPAAGGNIELRYLQENGDPVIYANAPALSAFIPGGKNWVRVDVAQAAQKLGVDLSGLAATATQNPASVLTLLRANGSVETVGTKTVNGVSTTHYRATIDLTKAAANFGSTGQEALGRLLAHGGPSTIPVDVWIGDDGYIHKLTLDESVGGGHVGLMLDISDYGTSVTVTAPPASDTLDATDLVGMIGSLPQGSATFPGTH